MKIRTLQYQVNAAVPPATGVPSWFNALGHKEWKAVAGGASETIKARYDENLADWGQVAGQIAPIPHGGWKTMVGSESGLTVDSVTGEILAVAMGGHNDYYGNEGYALNIRAETPSWVMCNRRTPVHSPVALYMGKVVSVTNDVLSPTGQRTTLVVSEQGSLPAGPFQITDRSCTHRLVWTAGTLVGGQSARLNYYEKVGTEGRFYLMNHNSPTSVNQAANLYTMNTPPAVNDEFAMCESFIDESYDIGGLIPGLYGDGRSRAMHTVNDAQYSNGKVWFAKQNSVASGQGQSAFGVVSFDRALTRGVEPYAWNRQITAPWALHGIVPITSSNANLIFQPSCLDPQTGKIWHITQGLSAFWSVDTNNGVADNERIKYYSMSSNNGGPLFSNTKSMWMVCIPGADPSGNGASIMVTADKNTHNVRVFRPSMVGPLGVGGATPTTSLSDLFGRVRLAGVPVQDAQLVNWRNGAGAGFSDEWGAVWHPEDKSILLWVGDSYGTDLTLNTPARGSVVRIKPPLVNGVYNPAGTWVCDVVPMPAGTPPPLVTTAGEHTNTFSKFNILKDFGGPGHHALVVVYGTGEPVYVCRLSGVL